MQLKYKNLGIDLSMVYNNTSNSGRLSLIPREINNRFQATKYPSIIPGGTRNTHI